MLFTFVVYFHINDKIINKEMHISEEGDYHTDAVYFYRCYDFNCGCFTDYKNI